MSQDTKYLDSEPDKTLDGKINYCKRFYEAIRRLNTDFGRDLRTAGSHGWIYVLRYKENDPRSPFSSQYRGYKEAAEHFEKEIEIFIDANYAASGY